MIAPGSVAARPSPAVRASQSVQASLMVASGSPAGRTRGELRAEARPPSRRRALLVVAAGRVHVTGVGQHVGGRPQLGEPGVPAVPAQQQHRGPGRHRPGRTGRSGPGRPGPACSSSRACCPSAAARSGSSPRERRRSGRGGLAPAVQDAADPRQVRDAPRARSRRPARRARRSAAVPGPVPGRRLPGAAGELVADTQEQQRHWGFRRQADHDGTHRFRVCHAMIMRADVSPGSFGGIRLRSRTE